MPLAEIGRDPRWDLLDRAEPLIVNRLCSYGVDEVRFVVAFPRDAFAVWLCVRSDQERDLLGNPNPLLEEVRSCVLEAGFSTSQVADLRTVAQSKETVDRDYEGSWFYALR
ncbi:hypothetical protein [Phytohabitans suffuscus]|uniref:Uncharacterized protein n=1 Tax=Phytohabitans suffuscus TaxID=624315 RepID=A0A6F8YRC0_9ACTN|nr:hypothetical protein [Phytohabitans suffuscus]BCB88697.1 hypothetical protein Psuf_060100 [Phytohabitans suffuscus]